MKILLIEPNYKNKFPPIGLMKISTYHKSKGDYVTFYKGIKNFSSSDFDIVYITSLFSFEYKITLDTVSHYSRIFIDSRIFFGGISASIMKNQYKEDLPDNVILFEKQITSSKLLGFDDDINIDKLVLDYDILDDIDYVYPENDSYFVHFSRGCVRSCPFCAVSILEPQFHYENNIKNIILETEKIYGIKKYLRVMDNNIMYLDEIDYMIDDLLSLGYGKSNIHYKKKTDLELLFDQLHRRYNQKQNLIPIFKKIYIFILDLYEKVKNNPKANKNFISDLGDIILLIDKYNLDFDFYNTYQNSITKICMHFLGSRRVKKVVDFNQGIDARGIVEYPERVIKLSQLNVDPFRVAFDSVNDKSVYIEAINIAHKSGIDKFSNYLLFNYNDKPEDIYERMIINIELNESLNLSGQFSFPMKYAPILRKDRKYIGKHWSKIQLDGFYAILNVSGGVVARERDFFYRAYGKNIDEFNEIIMMPTEFIKYRAYYEKNNFISKWKQDYILLDTTEVEGLKLAYMNNTWNDYGENVLNMKKYYFKSLHTIIK